ncbi:MAG: TonB-dependent receptor [Goleter apudmare HA4340-LM2]|nr:TonB-dependent receptor [Goleter apudmare HA4340-LM2]
MSIAIAVPPVSANEPEPVNPDPKITSQIPNLSDIQLPPTKAQLLTQDTPTDTPEASQDTDIELDVVGTPLVNFIEERQNSPTGVIILDQKEIQRFNYRTVGEVLRRQPGVVLGGPPGEDKDVRLLGLPKEYTQILINGQRFPDGGESREFKVDRIPVSLVERIEIISNPTATQNSQGVAGTVNIILKKAPDSRISDLTITGTTSETVGPFGGISLLYGDKQGDFSYLLSAGVQQREAPKDKFKQTLDLQNRPTQTERENEDKSLLDISIAPRFVWRASSRDTLTFDPLFLRTEEEKDATRNVNNQRFFAPSGRLQELQQQTVRIDEDKTITGWRLGGSWERQLSATADMKLGLLFQSTDESKDKVEIIDSTTNTFRNVAGSPLNQSRNTSTIKREAETKTDEELLGTLTFNFQPWDNHKFIVGLEGSLRDREKKKITTEQQTAPTLTAAVERTAPKDIYTIEENQLNVYIQDEISLGEKHTLTAGLRMEMVDNKATAGDSSTVGQSGTIFNPSLHYKYRVFPTTVDVQTRTPFLGLPNLTLFGNVSFLGSEVEDRTTREIRRFKEQPVYVANLGFDYVIPEWGMNFGLTYNILPGFENRELKDGKTEVTKQAGENSLDAYMAFRLADNVQLSLFGKNLLAAERSKDRTVFSSTGVFENSRIERETAERLYGISLSWQF